VYFVSIVFFCARAHCTRRKYFSAFCCVNYNRRPALMGERRFSQPQPVIVICCCICYCYLFGKIFFFLFFLCLLQYLCVLLSVGLISFMAGLVCNTTRCVVYSDADLECWTLPEVTTRRDAAAADDAYDDDVALSRDVNHKRWRPSTNGDKRSRQVYAFKERSQVK